MKPQLIALCASHINSWPRLAHFRHMVHSWIDQVCPIPLFVEMSVETPDLADQIRVFLAKIDDPFLTITIADNKRSQFGHYQALVDRLGTCYSHTWVLFTDDDDLWHPRRSETYANALANTPDLSIASHISSVCSYTRDICKKYADIASLAEIEHLPQTTHTMADRDYVQLCIRFSDLRLFFNILPPVVRDYQCCDILIERFITHTLSRKAMHVLPPVPLYFYRECSQYAHNRPTPSDMTDFIYWNGCLYQAKSGAKDSATIAKVAQILLRDMPGIPSKMIRRKVEAFWDDPLWHALRNFPMWHDVYGPAQCIL